MVRVYLIRGTATATVSYSAEYNTADLFQRGDIGLEIIRKEEDLQSLSYGPVLQNDKRLEI